LFAVAAVFVVVAAAAMTEGAITQVPCIAKYTNMTLEHNSHIILTNGERKKERKKKSNLNSLLLE
jgi:hypothetical protein